MNRQDSEKVSRANLSNFSVLHALRPPNETFRKFSRRLFANSLGLEHSPSPPLAREELVMTVRPITFVAQGRLYTRKNLQTVFLKLLWVCSS